MIVTADGTRNKAIIATLADSGYRMGEIIWLFAVLCGLKIIAQLKLDYLKR